MRSSQRPNSRLNAKQAYVERQNVHRQPSPNSQSSEERLLLEILEVPKLPDEASGWPESFDFRTLTTLTENERVAIIEKWKGEGMAVISYSGGHAALLEPLKRRAQQLKSTLESRHSAPKQSEAFLLAEHEEKSKQLTEKQTQFLMRAWEFSRGKPFAVAGIAVLLGLEASEHEEAHETFAGLVRLGIFSKPAPGMPVSWSERGKDLAKNFQDQSPPGYSAQSDGEAVDPVYDLAGVKWHEPSPPKLTNVAFGELGAHGRADVLLMTATAVELRQVLFLLRPRVSKRSILKVTKDHETYYLGRFGAFDVAVIRCEMGSDGPAGASHTARSALELWKPAVLIMVGIAFGVDKKKHLPADVLLAEQIVPYEGQRVGENKIYRDPIPPTGITLLNRFKNAIGWVFKRPDQSAVKIHSGKILSGAKLIDDPAFKKELIDAFPEAIGGEMEGAGLFAAATRARVEWILVKGVCDWADGKKHKLYQEMAAASAASLAQFVLSDKNALDGLLFDSLDPPVAQNTTRRLEQLAPDHRLFSELLSTFPSKGSIRFIGDHDFEASFNLEDLRDLFNFVEQWQDPEHEFLDDELELGRKELLDKSQHFLDLVYQNTFPTNVRPGQLRVPVEWQFEQFERFCTAVQEIRKSADAVIQSHEKLFRKGRRKFRI